MLSNSLVRKMKATKVGKRKENVSVLNQKRFTLLVSLRGLRLPVGNPAVSISRLRNQWL